MLPRGHLPPNCCPITKLTLVISQEPNQIKLPGKCVGSRQGRRTVKTGGNLGLGCWFLPAAGQPAGLLCGPDTPGGRDQSVCSTPHYTGCTVRVLALTQGPSQTCSLLIPKKDAWQVAQQAAERSQDRETGQLISLTRVMVEN